MTEPTTTPPAPMRPVDRVRSFLGYAFLISLLIHIVTLPFFGLKARQSDKPEAEKVSMVKKIKVVVPTPPPTPKPTPPPTPPPKTTPPPVKQTNPPPQPKLKVNPPKTTTQSKSAPSEKQYVVPKVGSQNGVPQGTVNSAPPAPPSTATGPPAVAKTAAPTPVPTTPPTPKPVCPVPNADASTVNAAEADYPDIARQQGVVGSVAVKVTLDAAGHVLATEINKSAGNASLDQSAIKAARASTFAPEVVNCVKTAGSYVFKVDFTGQ